MEGAALTRDGRPATQARPRTPPGGSPGALVGFVGGRDARAFARLGTSERRQAVLACFESLYGPRAAAAEAYLERDWAADPWSGGGPVGNFATGGWTAAGPALREPVGAIHWAGWPGDNRRRPASGGV